jgi:hypothetical protein
MSGGARYGPRGAWTQINGWMRHPRAARIPIRTPVGAGTDRGRRAREARYATQPWHPEVSCFRASSVADG